MIGITYQLSQNKVILSAESQYFDLISDIAREESALSQKILRTLALDLNEALVGSVLRMTISVPWVLFILYRTHVKQLISHLS